MTTDICVIRELPKWKNFSPALPKDLRDAIDEQLSQYSINYTVEYINAPVKSLTQSMPTIDATMQ